jgi:predicted ATP-grasp superfamily ATP-dependent carboligase
MKPAVVCVGESGTNGLATVRSLGRRALPVHVFSLRGSHEIASASRYCRSHTAVDGPADLCTALLDFARRAAERPVLYIDNDPILKVLAPHAKVLAARFDLVDPVGDAERLTDKRFQGELARRCGIAVPRTWFPKSWPELLAIRSVKRLIAKPAAGRADFKALIAANTAELAAALRGRIASPEQVLVQEFVEGDDAQIYAGLCYRAKSREQCFVLSARKIRQTTPGAGIMAVGQTVEAPQVREMTRRLAKAANVRGVLSTEFKLDARDGRYYFIEWNPRPAYFQSIGWKAGFDLAWLAYCDHADPAQLAKIDRAFSGEHFWINLHADLMNLSKVPERALDPKRWQPYLRRKQWAVFALDDLAPWRKSLRRLAKWLMRDRSFGRVLGRLAARRA